MRFSVWPSSFVSFAHISEVVVHCDLTGWDGAYVMDHFMLDRDDEAVDDAPLLEAFTLLAALAARTERLRLGPLVLGNTYRHPAVVAKSAVSLDAITGGRFVLGLGAGWQVNEHLAYGIDLFDTRTRLDRYEEACEVIRSLLHSDRTTIAGDHYSVTDAPCRPTPPDGRLPLLIGAKGEKRGLRIAARFADEWNSWATVEQLRHRSEVLARHCEDVGRDPAQIRRSTQALVRFVDDPAEAERLRAADHDRPLLIGSSAEMVDQVGAYAEAGLDELIVPDWFSPDAGASRDFLDRFHTEVASAFR
jgi:alkanesulfonate monooxygenase SsuD/methylene tetrahydromethanopterin reductase-like flavin-dependent oxidoreductase (luciferase family)